MHQILVKAVVVCLLLSAVTAIWLMTDDSLDPETRRWLESPTSPSSAILDAVTHLRALAEAAASEGVSRSDVDPDDLCTQLDEKCAGFVSGDRARIMVALPQCQAYWDAYHGVLQSEGLSADLERLSFHLWQPYMEALKFSVIRELGSYGRLRPEFMAPMINAQRQLLEEAPFLVDKMVLTATTSMSLTAMGLALQTTPPDDEGFAALLHALRPISTAEISLRRAMGGELRHMENIQLENSPFQLFFKHRHMLNMSRRMLAPIVKESEMSGKAFWGRDALPRWQPTWWDILFDPIGYRLAGVAGPAYTAYPENLQILRVQAELLRAWAGTLSGQPFPSPGTTPERLSNWVWVQNRKSLCLTPTADAPRGTEAGPVCL